jgi:hypothetical protein
MSTIGEHFTEASPDLRFVVGTNLEPAFLELGTKALNMSLHPEGHKGLSIRNGPPVLSVQQKSSED